MPATTLRSISTSAGSIVYATCLALFKDGGGEASFFSTLRTPREAAKDVYRRKRVGQRNERGPEEDSAHDIGQVVGA